MQTWLRPSSISVSTVRSARRAFTVSSRRHESISISRLLDKDQPQDEVTVDGWIRSVRKQKSIAFVALGDGSAVTPLQAVLLKPELASSLSYGTAVSLTGQWVKSVGGKQPYELRVSDVQVCGANDAEASPVQPKYQTPEYLRTIPHLRPRIPTNALLLRLRSQVIASLTEYFHNEDYVQTHPPIITSSDCEGAGEVFTVSPSKQSEPSITGTDGKTPDVEHFFRKEKYLSVSSQLHLEALAMAVNKVWTLSPTFRAEKSDTARHLAEFYMLEAELCFTKDLSTVMDIVESMLRFITSKLLSSPLSTQLLTQHSSRTSSASISDTSLTAATLETHWQGLTASSWPRITYATAIQTLETAASTHGITFEHSPSYTAGLQAEHERYLAEHVGRGSPVFVTDYPATQKPFYMSPSVDGVTEGKEKTVACFDLLVPDLCELAGGSLREHRLEELRAVMQEKGMDEAKLEWYLDLRRYGSVPHGGFGVGFDRLLCYLSGVGNVRDVVAFPRWYGRCYC